MCQLSTSTAGMASNDNGGKSASLHPIHHHCGGGHHHYFYVSPHCPLHRPILQLDNHTPSCSLSTSHQNPAPFASVLVNPQPSHLTTHPGQIFNDAQIIDNEIENLEDENEEEEDPIFVLTDEWREFFSKSEAKRKLAKKQAKKGKK